MAVACTGQGGSAEDAGPEARQVLQDGTDGEVVALVESRVRDAEDPVPAADELGRSLRAAEVDGDRALLVLAALSPTLRDLAADVGPTGVRFPAELHAGLAERLSPDEVGSAVALLTAAAGAGIVQRWGDQASEDRELVDRLADVAAAVASALNPLGEAVADRLGIDVAAAGAVAALEDPAAALAAAPAPLGGGTAVQRRDAALGVNLGEAPPGSGRSSVLAGLAAAHALHVLLTEEDVLAQMLEGGNVEEVLAPGDDAPTGRTVELPDGRLAVVDEDVYETLATELELVLRPVW